MSVSGIGGGIPNQQYNIQSSNKPEPYAPTRQRQKENTSDSIPRESAASLPEKTENTFLPEKAPSPTSLFIDQDFSCVEGTTQEYNGPLLSTGRQAPSYEELNEMSILNRQIFLKTLTPEERQEYAQYLRNAMNPGSDPQIGPNAGDTPQEYPGPVLSTGKQTPSYEEFNTMTIEQKSEYLASLTLEERQEYIQILRGSVA